MESIVIDGDINCRNQTKKKHKERTQFSIEWKFEVLSKQSEYKTLGGHLHYRLHRGYTPYSKMVANKLFFRWHVN